MNILKKLLLAGCLLTSPLSFAVHTPEWFLTATVEDVRSIKDPNAPCLTQTDGSPFFVDTGITVLHCATMASRDPEVVQALIDSGADIEAVEKESGLSPLYFAVKWQENPDVVDVFFDNGAAVLESVSYLDGAGAIKTLRLPGELKYVLILAMAAKNSRPVYERALARICQPNPLLKVCQP